ncbi:hypothetical protein Ga0123462_1744 [Mariprofundus ferrinatatus]|uniref:Uncharacterized protein n=1 Tax=Mariprofundus ferrinatatus TaxID=1921087 RepID=A0A2K8L9N0_9PROT|nr:hypothetical protein [Mariprofundus ferrinatatus]ATX82591.1 hypothetical protein Ga0123462_1744 [Mariprofundus ferrinatatus]
MKNMMFLAVFALFYSLSVANVGNGISTGIPAAQAKQEDKVTICHLPPGNPSNAQTLSVGASAVAAHLAEHGDYLGECGAAVVEEDRSGDSGSDDSGKDSGSDDSGKDSGKESVSDDSGKDSGKDGESKDDGEEAKVDVCHVTVTGGGSKDKDGGGSQTTDVQTLNISESALAAHLAHGDIAGECPTTPTCFLCGAGGPGDGTCSCPDGSAGSFVSGAAVAPQSIRSVQGQ